MTTTNNYTSMTESREYFIEMEGEYEGLYSVSNYGRIYYMKNDSMIYPNRKSFSGYYLVRLTDREGHKYDHLIHRLVSQYFMTDYNSYLYVEHLDKDKTNNVITNLYNWTHQDTRAWWNRVD